MKEKEIIEGNKLIASFMGGHLSNHPELNGVQVWSGYELIEGRLNLLSTLKFHSSWDWIMEVVQRISSLGYMVTIEVEKDDRYSSCRINDDGWGDLIREDYESDDIILESLIDIVWFECMIFIKWYNENNKS